jgi:hypothetical protein
VVGIPFRPRTERGGGIVTCGRSELQRVILGLGLVIALVLAIASAVVPAIPGGTTNMAIFWGMIISWCLVFPWCLIPLHKKPAARCLSLILEEASNTMRY